MTDATWGGTVDKTKKQLLMSLFIVLVVGTTSAYMMHAVDHQLQSLDRLVTMHADEATREVDRCSAVMVKQLDLPTYAKEDVRLTIRMSIKRSLPFSAISSDITAIAKHSNKEMSNAKAVSQTYEQCLKRFRQFDSVASGAKIKKQMLLDHWWYGAWARTLSAP